MRLIRLTITHRLWLGLGLILALFAAAHLVSLRAAHILDATLSEFLDEGEARSAAAYDMKINVEKIEQAVADYVRTGDAVHVSHLREAQAGFERALSSYRGVTATESSAALGQQAAERYARYRAQARELVRLRDNQAQLLAAYHAHSGKVQGLLQDMPLDWPARQPPPLHKRAAADALASKLRALTGGMGVAPDSGDALTQRLGDARRTLASALAQYTALADTHLEREWAAMVARWFTRTNTEAAALVEAQRLQRRGLANLGQLGRSLNLILDEGIQPAAKAELTAAMDKASGTAHGANLLIQRGLLLALVLGVLLAIFTSRAVKAPLRALVASSRRLAESDFSYRMPPAGRDELGELTDAFNDMAAKLQASTQARLNYLAYHDSLTDLPNRLMLAERVRSALNRAERSGQSIALLYLDLDNFKHVNDTLGHEEGDRLLQAMAARLKACVRGQDAVARLGGDEFAVLVEDVGDPRQVARVAEKIVATLAAPLELGGLELRTRASIGISMGPAQGANADELLKAADAAMYRAKRSGRGNYEFFSEDLTRQALERLTLENALRHPELHQQLVLYYQPQVSMRSGRIVGVEALLRWQHPARGRLSPHAFVGVAEETGLIHGIGAWVLRTACVQAKAWLERAYPPMQMAVNVSARQIGDDRIVGVVESVLRDTGLAPDRLELEVTEGALQTGEGAPDVLKRLKQLGVRLALDDFGTGYSGLSSLKLLPFDRLKIDRSFVQGLADDPNDRALARAIIGMGRSLKLDIVAEGVETDAQLAFLQEEGCDEVQGYLIGAPVTAEELELGLRNAPAPAGSTPAFASHRSRITPPDAAA